MHVRTGPGRSQGALALPRLGASVPRKIVPGRLGEANAAITRFLLDAKAFGEADVPASFDDSLRACEQALSRWIARQIGPLRCLRPAFHMQVLDGQGNTIDLYRGGDRGALPSYGGIEISWGEAGVHEVAVVRFEVVERQTLLACVREQDVDEVRPVGRAGPT